MTDKFIVHVRGSGGSGKSTTVRHVLESVDHQEIRGPDINLDFGRKFRRPVGYVLPGNLAVVGHYEEKCGGADYFKYHEVPDVIRTFAAAGYNILFESLLTSGSGENWLNPLMNDLSDYSYTTLVLNTPGDVAVERMIARNGKTDLNKEAVHALRNRILTFHDRFQGSWDSRILDWEDPVNGLVKVLKEKGWDPSG